jgi:hypothetical protein
MCASARAELRRPGLSAGGGARPEEAAGAADAGSAGAAAFTAGAAAADFFTMESGLAVEAGDLAGAFTAADFAAGLGAAVGVLFDTGLAAGAGAVLAAAFPVARTGDFVLAGGKALAGLEALAEETDLEFTTTLLAAFLPVGGSAREAGPAFFDAGFAAAPLTAGRATGLALGDAADLMGGFCGIFAAFAADFTRGLTTGAGATFAFGRIAAFLLFAGTFTPCLLLKPLEGGQAKSACTGGSTS